MVELSYSVSEQLFKCNIFRYSGSGMLLVNEQEFKEVVENIDAVSLMTYDYSNPIR